MTATGAPLRVGIIGTGGIANAHAEALSGRDDVELAVAVDLDPSRAEAFGAKWNIPRIAGDLQSAVDLQSAAERRTGPRGGLHATRQPHGPGRRGAGS